VKSGLEERRGRLGERVAEGWETACFKAKEIRSQISNPLKGWGSVYSQSSVIFQGNQNLEPPTDTTYIYPPSVPQV